MKNSSYAEFAKKLMEHDNIVMFPHMHMDGDTLGSSSALCMALRSLGKHAVILAGEETPASLDFLEYGCVTRDLDAFRGTAAGQGFGDIGLALMVDCGNLSRIEGREDVFLSAPVKACIDHHGISIDDTEFDFGRVEADSAAAGEIIYYVIRELGVAIDLPMANALYAAISTDTGDYSYSNTTARSHQITEAFFQVPGFNPKPVRALINERVSFNTLRLEGEMVRGIRLYYGGRLGIGRVTQEMLAETGAKMSDTDGFVNKVLGINGVEAACLLKEFDEKLVRVSLRAKADVNVAAIAVRHDGGGHVSAAGCTFRGTIVEAERILREDFAFLEDGRQ
ncbi:MAG: bifunctional oligoribonuclease/PAP phosphatase NrnA [Mogibacterium sp.]|nr:bifunctional oligoribonuclease/PAP phosphatase NrnA [Mogibacterium sp.]